MKGHWITSMGLDLGTSTTKMIISRLRLMNTGGQSALPRVEIAERQLVYASPIYTTPLKNHEEIQMEAISDLIQQEYQKAKVSLADIQTGAVIITGETATKKNAEVVVHSLAHRAGDFVVATAGADLEAILAGKGSGAERRSLENQAAIANIDIGGGTANTVFFENGETVGTLTFHVGGRLIRLDAKGTLHYVSDALKPWLTANGYTLTPSESIDLQHLMEMTRRLCESMVSYLLKRNDDNDAELLILGNSKDMRRDFQELVISGGIGSLLDQELPQSMEEVAVYGDFGPLLAPILREVCLGIGVKVVQAKDAGRATVLGAGMQSTEMSGSTIYANPLLLPLRNVPVLQVDLDAEQGLAKAINIGITRFQDLQDAPFALALMGPPVHSYADLISLADQIASLLRTKLSHKSCMVILCEHDMAKALGQSIFLRCRQGPPVICIDQVQVRHGDYVDIGKPVAGEAIPITVKTLVFSEGNQGGGVHEKNNLVR